MHSQVLQARSNSADAAKQDQSCEGLGALNSGVAPAKDTTHSAWSLRQRALSVPTLVQLKKEYDPQNFLHLNQNIIPRQSFVGATIRDVMFRDYSPVLLPTAPPNQKATTCRQPITRHLYS
jgi:hypothetical protein